MISSQQSSDYAALAPRFNDFDHLSKPFNFLDLNKSTEATTIVAACTATVRENWYQNGVRNGEPSSSTSGEDTDNSNGSTPKIATIITTNGRINEEKVTQDHHARRPMNAFLIFCKRHRNIVRERYPNLENRAITKILGDWWANLNDIEKSCYTNLAKEYKDAFFNANPDFKWYKLPAPPLRTLSYNRMNSGNDSSDCDSLNRSSESSDPAVEQNQRKSSVNAGVGTFKLADEAQMGGLNSLMMAADIVRNITNNNYKLNADQSTEDDLSKDEVKDAVGLGTKNELHRVLGETGSFLQNTMKDYNDQADVFSFDASDIKNIPQRPKRSKTCSSSDFESIDDDLTGSESSAKKSTRACKGKRYMEFMSAHRAQMIPKRITKPRTTSTSSSASLSPTQPPRSIFRKPSPTSVQKMDFETFDHLYANHFQAAPVAPKQSTEMEPVTSTVGDFELEHKIGALPAHNLDEYLSRKQNTKKKKKQHDKRSTNGHRKVHKITKPKQKPITAPKTIEEAKERLAMVGSQKRKARKESITRRDVHQPQMTAIVQSFVSPASDSFTINLPDNNSTRCGTSGLLMLAAMAEVAANYAA